MFTVCHSDRAQTDIGEDIQSIIAAIDEHDVPYDAIYLVGSFGRGEGSVHFDGMRWRAVNDYDIVIVSSTVEAPHDHLKRLGQKLAESLQVDFVDLGWLPRSILPHLPLTIENYDLRNASSLLKGRDVVGEMPNFSADQISAYEFARLLCNRTAGILSSQSPARLGSSYYRRNQYRKACIAVGDTAVYLNEGYHPSYRRRSDIFSLMVAARGVPFPLSEESATCVMAAYASKLDGDATNGFRVNDKLMRDMIESAFTAIAHRCIGRNIISVDEAGKELAIYYRRNRKVMEKVDDLICVWLRHDKRRADELRLRILFSMPAVYIRGLEKTLSQKLFYLSRFWCVPGALKRLNDPSSIVSLWEEYCH